ncbi:phage terminase large subunit [Limibacillus sp. MBR-115]|jgi:predicted phage terminase large subunit-like protein|uniref:phage terminase large subunit n=1 Tax=Limibacillus sp. MBR-115 TaxID=3156465 RepID=UPI0033910959
MKLSIDRAAANAHCRTSLAAFAHTFFDVVYPGHHLAHNWHIEAICYQLERLAAGEMTRLIVNLPPRSLKSYLVSVCFPVWLLGRDPGTKIVCASYSEKLAVGFSHQSRLIMASPRYREIYPGTKLSRSKNTEMEFHTTQNGFRLAVSVGGTLTGLGGDIILIDDPLKADDAFSKTAREGVNRWFDSVARSRLDHPGEGRICLVSQRLHLGDLAGHLLESTDEWHHLKLPAIAVDDERIPLGCDQVKRRKPGDLLFPGRLSQTTLDGLRAGIGSLSFEAQYQQSPRAPEGNCVKQAWIRSYEDRPTAEASDRIIQSWDTANKTGEANDYSVCTTWLQRGDYLYLLELWRGRLAFPELCEQVHALKARDNPATLLIEDMGSGQSLIQHLRAKQVAVDAVKPEGDKMQRLISITPKIQAGGLWLPAQAPWREDFLEELLSFPSAPHDDQVDSLSQAFAWARDNPPEYCGKVEIGGGVRQSYWDLG